MQNKTILITGGRGFIGNLLAQKLSSKGYGIRVFDIAAPSTDHPLAGEYLQGDLSHFPDVLNACKGCCGIVHLAGISRESLVKKNPLACIQTNVLGGLHILEAIRRNGNASWIVIGSTWDTPSFSLGSLPDTSLYGISKFTVDMLAKAYVRDFGGRTLVARFGDVYGSDCDHPQKVLPLFFHKARYNQSIEVLEPDGPFDFTHIDDILDGIVMSITFLESQASPFFQDITLCTGRITLLRDLARLIVETLDSKSLIHVHDAIGPLPDMIKSDPAPAFDLLGFRAGIILYEGLKKMALMAGFLK